MHRRATRVASRDAPFGADHGHPLPPQARLHRQRPRSRGQAVLLPELREKLDIRHIAYPRPRREIVELVGDVNQGCPNLVLDTSNHRFFDASRFYRVGDRLHTNDTRVIVDSTETIRITAEIEPASNEITDRLFAADAAAVKIIAEPDGEGALQVGLSWKPDNRKKREDWSDLAMVERVSRIRAKFTLRIPKTKEVAVDSMDGDLLIEGNVGELTAECMNGDLEVREIVEAAVVESLNGSLVISLADSARCDIEAMTLNGAPVVSLIRRMINQNLRFSPFGSFDSKRVCYFE